MAEKCIVYKRPKREWTCKDLNRVLISVRKNGRCDDMEVLAATVAGLGIKDFLCVLADILQALNLMKIPLLMLGAFKVIKALIFAYNVIWRGYNVIKLKLPFMASFTLENNILSKGVLAYAWLAASMDVLIAAVTVYLSVLDNVTAMGTTLKLICANADAYAMAEKVLDIGVDLSLSEQKKELDAAHAEVERLRAELAKVGI